MDSCRYTVQAGASGVRVASGVVGDYSHTHNPSVIGHYIYISGFCSGVTAYRNSPAIVQSACWSSLDVSVPPSPSMARLASHRRLTAVRAGYALWKLHEAVRPDGLVILTVWV